MNSDKRKKKMYRNRQVPFIRGCQQSTSTAWHRSATTLLSWEVGCGHCRCMYQPAIYPPASFVDPGSDVPTELCRGVRDTLYPWGYPARTQVMDPLHRPEVAPSLPRTLKEQRFIAKPARLLCSLHRVKPMLLVTSNQHISYVDYCLSQRNGCSFG